MNLSLLRDQIATIHRKTAADFTIAGVDILTPAINAASRKAQRMIDFEYSNVNADLTINGTTLSGNIANATLAGTATAVLVKRIQHVSIPVDDSQFIPIEFLTDETQSDRLKRQVGRTSYDPTLTIADYGIGETAPYAWQQGQTLYFGPATQFTDALVATTFTSRLNIVKFLPDYVDGETVTVTLSGTPYTFTAYGGTLNGSPIYFGNNLALWRDLAGTDWFITNAKSTQINDTTPNEDYYQLTTTSTSPAGTYTEHASGTPTCVVGTPTGITTDFIMDQGWRYLLWESVLQTNRYFKTFAPKTEGNIDEANIEAYAKEAYQELAQWNSSLTQGTTSPAGIPGTGS